jgi:hypothetical protein
MLCCLPVAGTGLLYIDDEDDVEDDDENDNDGDEHEEGGGGAAGAGMLPARVFGGPFPGAAPLGMPPMPSAAMFASAPGGGGLGSVTMAVQAPQMPVARGPNGEDIVLASSTGPPLMPTQIAMAHGRAGGGLGGLAMAPGGMGMVMGGDDEGGMRPEGFNVLQQLLNLMLPLEATFAAAGGAEAGAAAGAGEGPHHDGGGEGGAAPGQV